MTDYILPGIKNMPEADRPYEKMLAGGASALTPAELISVIICSGNRNASATELAAMLLSEGRNLAYLDRAEIYELSKLVPGIGKVKALRIKAAFELGRRLRLESLESEKVVITSADDVMKWFEAKIGHLPHEEFHMMMLDSANTLIHSAKICSGGLSRIAIDPKDVFKLPLRYNASAIILAHNHPSGKTEASAADIKTTKRLKEAADLLGLRLLDHVIAAQGSSISMKREGYF